MPERRSRRDPVVQMRVYTVRLVREGGQPAAPLRQSVPGDSTTGSSGSRDQDRRRRNRVSSSRTPQAGTVVVTSEQGTQGSRYKDDAVSSSVEAER